MKKIEAKSKIHSCGPVICLERPNGETGKTSFPVENGVVQVSAGRTERVGVNDCPLNRMGLGGDKTKVLLREPLMPRGRR